MNELLKVGDEINLISMQYSSFYPELVPIEVAEDPLVGGNSSIRYFIQSERVPGDNTAYKAEIEEIEISDKFEDDKIIIYIILHNLERVISINRKRNSIINLKEETKNSRNYFNDEFCWNANSGQVRLPITKEKKVNNPHEDCSQSKT